MLFASRSSVSVRERIPLAAVAISESIEVPLPKVHASSGPPSASCKESCAGERIHDYSRQESGARHDLVVAHECRTSVIYLLLVPWRVWHGPCKNLARANALAAFVGSERLVPSVPRQSLVP